MCAEHQADLMSNPLSPGLTKRGQAAHAIICPDYSRLRDHGRQEFASKKEKGRKNTILRAYIDALEDLDIGKENVADEA